MTDTETKAHDLAILVGCAPQSSFSYAFLPTLNGHVVRDLELDELGVTKEADELFVGTFKDIVNKLTKHSSQTFRILMKSKKPLLNILQLFLFQHPQV